MQEIVTQNLAIRPEQVAELPHAEAEEAQVAMGKAVTQQIDEAVLKGDQTKTRVSKRTSTLLTPIGVTKASHEESKNRRKASAKSRKINRGK